MKDSDCVQFLQWALPQLQMRWQGFRKVRAQVCKRVARRMRQLDIENVADYRAYLTTHPQEWAWLDTLSHITISRFYRDQAVFAFLESDVLPALARRAADRPQGLLRAWSVGCACGEESYTLALMWKIRCQPRHPDVHLQIVASDADSKTIERARSACYPYSSIKHLPVTWHHEAFDQRCSLFCLKPEYRGAVRFMRQDVRTAQPDGMFDLVLCRNLVFTYFNQAQQRNILARIRRVIRPGGILVIGIHEDLPAESEGFCVFCNKLRIFQKSRQ